MRLAAMRRLCATALALSASLAARTALADGFEASFEDGLRWRSAGRELELHAGGTFAADALWQSRDHRPGSQLRVDLAALELEASYRRTWLARIVGDLEGTKTAGNLYEASLAWRPDPRLRISAGLLPLALGFEAAIPPEDLSFVGHSYARYMAYRTDWALRVELELADGVFAADVAWALGDGFDANGEPRRDSQLQGRAFLRPLRGLAAPDAGWLRSTAAGFFFGGGYAHGFDYDGELEIRSPVGTELFDTTRFDADSSRFYTFFVGFEVGPLRMFYEGTQGGYFDAVTPAGVRDLEDQTDSWQAQLAWMITGESYDGRLLAEPARRGPNAWELAVRYANGDIDRDFFAFGLTTPIVSSQEFRSWTVALNWYATPCARISLELVHTQADDDIANLDGDSIDDAALVRVQYRF